MIRYSTLSLIVLLTLVANSVTAAVIIDFENFADGGVDDLNLAQTFAAANTAVPGNQTLTNLAGFPAASFGLTGGITFSGGVLLEAPTETGTNFPDVAGVPVGSVFYATANAPSTSALPSPLLSDTITINITAAENVTLIEGILINGLDTESLDPNFLTPYTVSYFNNDSLLFRDDVGGSGLASNEQNGSALFSFDSMTMGSMLGALITRVEITTDGDTDGDGDIDGDDNHGIPFGGTNPEFEYDFLIDALSFNQSLQPVPIPAALPLFLSALLGGWVFARPRKPSESKR